jgi:hypothetical protein
MTKIETFKCATGSGWGILVDGMMDCQVPYSSTEKAAIDNAIKAGYKRISIIDSMNTLHYSKFQSIEYSTILGMFNDERDRLNAINSELLELAHAFLSYLEDDSRSPRRRDACLESARAAIARAKGQA